MADRAAMFAESLDTIRFGSEATSRDAAAIQARLDVGLSLLFGNRIVIPRAVSFDSLGFLSIADELLDLRSERRNEESPVSSPLILSLYEYPSYRATLAAKFSESTRLWTPKRRDYKERFILSAWPEIDRETRERSALAGLLAAGNFEETKSVLPEAAHWKVDVISRLDDYFVDSRVESAHSRGLSLRGHGALLAEADLRDWGGVDASYVNEAEAIQDGVQELMDRTSFSNRSEVREVGSEVLPADVLAGVIEYVDTCYNAVVARSVAATTELFVTSSQEGTPYPVIGEQLAWAAIARGAPDTDAEPDEAEMTLAPAPLDVEVSLDRGLSGQLGAKSKEFLSASWELTQDNSWVTSMRVLRESMNAGKRTAAEAALDHHLELLTSLDLSLIDTESEGRGLTYAHQIGATIGTTAGSPVAAALQYRYGVPSIVTIGAAAAAGIKAADLIWRTGGRLSGTVEHFVSRGLSWRSWRRSVELFERPEVA